MPAAAPEIALRRVTDADEESMSRLLSRLSAEDRYRRWFTGAVDLDRATRDATHVGTGDVGLVAMADDEVVGHGVLARYGKAAADVAFEVDPAWRHHGIATRLLQQLVVVARDAGVRTLTADVLCENPDMLAVFHEHGGFVSERVGGTQHLTLDLGGS